MLTTAPLDLKTLPPPDIIREPEFTTLFAEYLEQFKELNPNYAYYLASDPIVKLLMTIAYKEMQWRQFINAVCRTNLLSFAKGGDLDHLGASPYAQVERNVVDPGDPNASPVRPPTYEDDESFRYRIQLAIASFSKTGTAEHYEFHARSIDSRVRDVLAYSPDYANRVNFGGRVNICVMSKETGFIPSIDLLNTVRNYITRKDVKMLSDMVTVEPAVPKDVSVSVKVVLLPNTPVAVFTGLTALFNAAFLANQFLGWDVTVAWVQKTLMVDGVYDVQVVTPETNTVVTPVQFPRLTSLSIVFGGFATTGDFDPLELTSRALYQQVYEYYITYCIAVKRTVAEIASDLMKEARAGIIQPTTLGLAQFLNIEPLRNSVTQAILPEDELAFLIHRVISAYYASGTPQIS